MLQCQIVRRPRVQITSDPLMAQVWLLRIVTVTRITGANDSAVSNLYRDVMTVIAAPAPATGQAAPAEISQPLSRPLLWFTV